MPASTRFDLPLFRYFEASALNAGLAGITVGVFGGKNARDFNPDSSTTSSTSWRPTSAVS